MLSGQTSAIKQKESQKIWELLIVATKLVGGSWYSINQLQRETKLSKKSIRRKLKLLGERGFLRKKSGVRNEPYYKIYSSKRKAFSNFLMVLKNFAYMKFLKLAASKGELTSALMLYRINKPLSPKATMKELAPEAWRKLERMTTKDVFDTYKRFWHLTHRGKNIGRENWAMLLTHYVNGNYCKECEKTKILSILKYDQNNGMYYCESGHCILPKDAEGLHDIHNYEPLKRFKNVDLMKKQKGEDVQEIDYAEESLKKRRFFTNRDKEKNLKKLGTVDSGNRDHLSSAELGLLYKLKKGRKK